MSRGGKTQRSVKKIKKIKKLLTKATKCGIIRMWKGKANPHKPKNKFEKDRC